MPAGPSIYDLIETEFDTAEGEYRAGLTEILLILQGTRPGSKPFYEIQNMIKTDKACGFPPEYIQGLEVGFFIFKSPYQWIASKEN